MSLEANVVRKRKRVLEATVTGFNGAPAANSFVDELQAVLKRIYPPQVKYRGSIAATNTTLAITDRYDGPSACKLTILEIPDNNTALAIIESVKKTYLLNLQMYGAFSKDELKLRITEKPQPQRIELQPVRLFADVRF